MLTRKQRDELRKASAAPNRLERAMELAGLTQVQLAERIGYTQGYISKVKNGQYSDELPGETMRRFAQFFGCVIEDLFPAPAAITAAAQDRRSGDDRRTGGDRRSEVA